MEQFGYAKEEGGTGNDDGGDGKETDPARPDQLILGSGRVAPNLGSARPAPNLGSVRRASVQSRQSEGSRLAGGKNAPPSKVT